jgi:hypothetical protein
MSIFTSPPDSRFSDSRWLLSYVSPAGYSPWPIRPSTHDLGQTSHRGFGICDDIMFMSTVIRDFPIRDALQPSWLSPGPGYDLIVKSALSCRGYGVYSDNVPTPFGPAICRSPTSSILRHLGLLISGSTVQIHSYPTAVITSRNRISRFRSS